jgi:hypothetical protein
MLALHVWQQQQQQPLLRLLLLRQTQLLPVRPLSIYLCSSHHRAHYRPPDYLLLPVWS